MSLYWHHLWCSHPHPSALWTWNREIEQATLPSVLKFKRNRDDKYQTLDHLYTEALIHVPHQLILLNDEPWMIVHHISKEGCFVAKQPQRADDKPFLHAYSSFSIICNHSLLPTICLNYGSSLVNILILKINNCYDIL